jgi:hypothetical protein
VSYFCHNRQTRHSPQALAHRPDVSIGLVGKNRIAGSITSVNVLSQMRTKQLEMNDKLSQLQRFVLTRANDGSGVYLAEILELYFGWQPVRPELREQNASGSRRFSRKQIGSKKYREVLTALSRSCRRLEQRGYVKRIAAGPSRGAGVQVTDLGKIRLVRDKFQAESAMT